MKIILGSQSKGRAQVLRDAGFSFETMSADIDEKAIRDENPEKLVLALAYAKADALLNKIHEPALLITTDLVVVCDGTLREKPADAAEARLFLASYTEHPAEAINGVVVTNTKTGKHVSGTERATIMYKPSLLSIIDELIAQGDVLHCAGAFRAQDPVMFSHMEKIEGTTDIFAGMPIVLVKRLLEEAERA